MKYKIFTFIRYCLITMILLSFTGGSCRKSLMYNPSLNMPVHAPTRGGDYWLFTAIGLYPEARPEKVKQGTHQIGLGVGATVPLWKELSLNLLLNAGE